jgi:hypothetical protein
MLTFMLVIHINISAAVQATIFVDQPSAGVAPLQRKRYHRMTDPHEIAWEALYALSACQPSDLHLQAQR